MTTAEFVKRPTSTVLVRFQDCDPYGHLNNARYLDYFFNAREDHLASFYNFGLFGWSKAHNEGWVVTQNQLAYLRPAVVNELVTIQTCLQRFTESQLYLEGIMADSTQERVKAVLWAEFSYVSLATGRVVKHEDELLQLFSAVQTEDEVLSKGFSERVQQLKRVARTAKAESTLLDV
jgi:YbgC/YbaW family acyl-CoA thioester hydrolase